VISVLINRFPNKPEFLRSNSAVRNVDASAKSEKFKESKLEKAGKKTSEFTAGDATYSPADMVEADLKELEVSDGSFIEFYKNGEKQAQCFMDIYEADYYAAISLYMNARVAINFGQAPFKHLDGILSDLPMVPDSSRKGSKKQQNQSPQTPSEQKKYSDIKPYWSLCNSSTLQKLGVFKIKSEKLEDY